MQRIPNIVPSRLRAETPANHPDANQLSAFAEKSLTELERTEVLNHLSRCIECRDVLALALPATESVQLAAKPSPTRWLTWPALRWGFVTAGVAVIAAFAVMKYQLDDQTDTRLADFRSQSENVKLSAKVQPAPLYSHAPASQAETAVAKTSSSATLDANQGKDQPPAAVQNAEPRTGNRAPAATLPAAPRPNAMIARGLLAHGGPSTGIAAPLQRNELAPPQKIEADSSKKVPAASETVEVQAAAPKPLQTSQAEGESIAAAPPAEDSDAKVGKAKDAAPGGAATATDRLAVSGRTLMQLSAVKPGLAPRWNITSIGSLQRSFDQGGTWQDVDVTGASSTGAVIAGPLKAPSARADAKTTGLDKQAAQPIFRAVAANGADVWAGGSASMLYHSSDGGNHWSRVLPSGNGSVLTGDIVSVEFPDLLHGKITTSAPEVWTTPDNGQTWQKQ